MQRRHFVASSIAASAAVLVERGNSAQAAVGKSRQFYELRRYHLRSGPQVALTESYVKEALIPGLNRMGFSPVGAFHVDVGSEAPMLYVLTPGASVEALAMADLRLAEDAAFVRSASPFWSAPAEAPPYVRYESSLLAAFAGWPRLTVPASTVSKAKRMFQLRTYESPTNGAHVRKVEMFHHGEFEIFEKAGFAPVFFGDALTGERLPKLTYMLAFADVAELTAKWDVFRNDPAWKKLSGDTRYAYEAIVSNIDNLYLSPTAYSQI